MCMQNVFKLVVNETIAPLFKEEGYKKQGKNFAHVRSDFSTTVNIQSSKWNTKDEVEFFFNTGIYVEKVFMLMYQLPKPKFPLEINSVMRIGGTALTKDDSWYRLTADTDVEQLKQKITNDITEYILPYLRQFESITDVIQVMESRERNGVFESPHHLTILYCSIGDMEKAQERMTRVYNKSKLDSQRKFAEALANRLGLRV